MFFRLICAALAALILFPTAALCADALPLPRFACVRSDETNVRTGPGKRYQIKWVVTKKNMPVEIVREFEQWRKIRDIRGDEGWVHANMLSGGRYVITQGSAQVLRKASTENSRAVAKLESGVHARLESCDGEWCHVEVSDEVDGYLKRTGLWGVYPGEVIE